MQYSKPYERGLFYQTTRKVTVLLTATYQTSRKVTEFMEVYYQTVRMVVNEFTFHHVVRFQTMRIVQHLYERAFQTIRTVSLWVLPTHLYGTLKQTGLTVKGRFKRK